MKYPLMTHVLKFEYAKAPNFKNETTVECVTEPVIGGTVRKLVK